MSSATKKVEDDCCKRSSTVDDGRRGSAASQRAAELAKYIYVSTFKNKKAPGANVGMKKSRDEKVNTKTSVSESLQIIGTQSIRWSGAEDRPGWTATTIDMAKDLISRKANLAENIAAEHRKLEKKFLASQLATLPFHTLLVRWRLSYNFPIYTPRIVYGLLSRFGQIDIVGNLSINSVFVVFHYEFSASRATTAQVGFNYCPLICTWWYLERYQFPVTDPAEVKREDILVADGRLERNSKRHMAQIKREFWKKAAALSYDVSTFRP